MEAGSLLPTGQSDTGKFPAAGKHYFTLEYRRACPRYRDTDARSVALERRHTFTFDYTGAH